MHSRRHALRLVAAGMTASSLMATISPVPAALAQDANAGGSMMWRGTAARTGEFLGPLPSLDRPIVVKWQFPTEGYVFQPTVAGGTVFVVSQNDTGITAWGLDATTGEERWRFPQPGNLMRLSDTPVAVANGTAFIRVRDDEESFLLAVEPESGSERWRFSVGSGGIDPLIVNQTVYVAGENVYALDVETGGERWRVTTGNEDWSVNDIAVADGMVCFSVAEDDGMRVHAVDAASGLEMWQWSTSLDRWASYLMVADGSVYFFVDGGQNIIIVYALDANTGEERWQFPLTAEYAGLAFADSSLFVDYYIGTGGGRGTAFALDPETGTPRWSFEHDGRELAPSVIASTLLLFNSQRYVIALDPATGSEHWRARPEALDGNPVATDGVIYGGMEGTLYAIGNAVAAVLAENVTLRGAPSETGVERGTAKAGDEVGDIRNTTTESSTTWVEVTIGEATGWIPQDAIDPASYMAADQVDLRQFIEFS